MSPRPATLFPTPSKELLRGLDGFADLLDRTHRLRSKHLGALPAGIRRLSEFLTTDRDELPRDYMSRPEYLSAYLRWFLPWNLYRQGRLLEGLDLNLPAGCRIVDLGAGPWTFLLALWLSRPHLRRRDLEYVAVDRADTALQAGAALFGEMAGSAGQKWRGRSERTLAGHRKLPRADLLVAANFLNEIEMGAPKRGRALPVDEEESVAEVPEHRLLERWENQVTGQGAVLLIEPGTRTAARPLVRIRQAALQRGWEVAAPCPHAAECPQPGRRGGPWCHFSFDAQAAPFWLHRLARRAKLPKERTSLSFLLLTRHGSAVAIRPAPRPGPQEAHCLVVSDPFELPDRRRGRYGCSERGLVLLQEKADRSPDAGPQSGEMLTVRWPEEIQRDGKSGALILPRSDEGRKSPRRG